MLKLRVQIPDIGKEYDVQCNEKAYVEDVIQDILDLICRKESLQVEKEEKLAVYSVQKGSFLKKSNSNMRRSNCSSHISSDGRSYMGNRCS